MNASVTKTRRRGLTDRQVAALKKKAKRYVVPDPELRGHYIRVMPKGPVSFVAVARKPYDGKQVWTTIGTSDLIKIDEARERAREIIKRVKAGRLAVEPPPVQPDSFEATANNWLQQHVVAKGLLTGKDIERRLTQYVMPHWRDRAFESIRRSDIAALLDSIVKNHGARTADMVLSDLRSISLWYASRSDDYVVPFIRGMQRASNKARDRILNDDELRAVWKAAEANGTFGALVRLALCTAQRREKLITMRWSDIADGVWTVAVKDKEREKGHGGVLVLPPQALRIIEAQPRFESNPHVFAANRGRRGYFNNLSEAKALFDAKLPDMPHWTLHDLRRTARSLMSRAGVQRDHAERVLGHVITGIEGIYNRYAYRDEKAEALTRLAAMIENIVNPPEGNVLPLRKRRKVAADA